MVCVAFCFLVDRAGRLLSREPTLPREKGVRVTSLGFGWFSTVVSCFDLTKYVWGSRETRLETLVFFSLEGNWVKQSNISIPSVRTVLHRASPFVARLGFSSRVGLWDFPPRVSDRVCGGSYFCLHFFSSSSRSAAGVRWIPNAHKPRVFFILDRTRNWPKQIFSFFFCSTCQLSR